MARNKLSFDLFAMLEWTAVIAFLCALLAGSGGKATWTSDFKSLPPDDSTLLSWLEEQGRNDVIVTREGHSVTLQAQSGAVAGIFNAFDSLPKPPWQELGYMSLQGVRGLTQWTMFNGSPYLWLTGFGVLIALGLIRRRYIKPIQNQKETDTNN